MSSQYFLAGSNLEKCGNVLEKTDLFLGRYGQIGEIQHGRIFSSTSKNILKIVYFFKTMLLL